ncbi:hypothetical protein MAXJ12_17853 [Mesorhizobium alhagi CCNWXJ12-2]|uniref:Uncharacterized protein n=1 Tax=Mesorhizobium alhagi CCNWXJ12-2 TaxID=1107882 RepID=H0HTS9_9HYPH|nr:hypothetical protein MAXJ12_17853 [Mesorhizobium alhagi CCNWXJ12-2]
MVSIWLPNAAIGATTSGLDCASSVLNGGQQLHLLSKKIV